METVIRSMVEQDGRAVRAIYEEGIAERQATFETSTPSWRDWDAAHCADCRLVAEAGANIVGWAALSPVSHRRCYSGVAEVSVYVRRSARGQGVGAALLKRVIEASEACGFWTLQGATFPDNEASLRLQAGLGFRVVGRRERIAKLDGVWRDTVITERRSSTVGLD